MSALTLYELAAADPAIRFSPHCWKTRMALAHKGLEAHRRAWRFMDKEVIALSGQQAVPVLVNDNDEFVYDSWEIALYLERNFPDRPSLFGGAGTVALTRFINRWADAALLPSITPLILYDIYLALDPNDQPYFRASREKRFGKRLEDFAGDLPTRFNDLRNALTPLRQMLKDQPFIAGDQAAYADYCVFGMFMWARCISAVELLEQNDPVYAWHERLLDAFSGLARQAPTIHTTHGF